MNFNKHIFIMLSVLFIFLSANAQEKIISLKQLSKKTSYVYDKQYYGYRKKIYKGEKTRRIQDVTNKEKVLRIYIYLDTIYPNLPINTKDYPNVQELVIEGDLFHLPYEIFEFKKLQVLRFSELGQEVSTSGIYFNFPKELFELKHLKVLSLANLWGEIRYIPEKISELKQLEYLYLENRWIDILPLSLANLPNLKFVHISRSGGIDVFDGENTYFKERIPQLNLFLGRRSQLGDLKLHKRNKKNTLSLISINEYSHDYKNGQKQVEGKLVDGKPNGKWSFYYENGKVKLERFYEKGVEIGTWTAYDTLGYKTKEYIFTPEENKVNILFYEQYEPTYKAKIKAPKTVITSLEEEITLINGKKEGDWVKYAIKKYSSKEVATYKNDKLIKKTTIEEDGDRMKWMIEYKNGFPGGASLGWINWNTKAQRKIYDAFYVNGKLDEKCTVWYKNGAKKLENLFVKGKRIYCKGWDELGNPVREIIWKDGGQGYSDGYSYYTEVVEKIHPWGKYKDTKWLANGIKQVTLRDEEKNETKITTYNKQGETIKEELYKDGKLVKTE